MKCSVKLAGLSQGLICGYNHKTFKTILPNLLYTDASLCQRQCAHLGGSNKQAYKGTNMQQSRDTTKIDMEMRVIINTIL